MCVVSTDSTLRATAGRMVKTVTSQTFLADFEPATHVEEKRAELADRLDDETRARLERLRRGESRRSEHTFLSNEVHRKVLVQAWTVCYVLPQPEGETSSRRPTSGG